MLRRYTTLPVLLDLLVTKQLTLLTPASWDDRNDAYYLEQYREKKKLKSVCAICFTGANETYHHWRVFSHGNSGVCVTFVFDKLCAHLGKDPGIAAGEVKYHRIDALEAKPPNVIRRAILTP